MDVDRTKDLIDLEEKKQEVKANAFRKLFLNVMSVFITENEKYSYQQGMNMILGKLLMAQPLCEAAALFSALCGWLLPRPWFQQEELRDNQMTILTKALSVFDKELGDCLAADTNMMMIIVPTKWYSLFTEYGTNVYKLWNFVFTHGDLDYFYIILLADLLVNRKKVLQIATKDTSKKVSQPELYKSIRFETDVGAVVRAAHDISSKLRSKKIWLELISCWSARMAPEDARAHLPLNTEYFSSPRFASLPQQCCLVL